MSEQAKWRKKPVVITTSPVRWYRCAYCGAWHVGHGRKGRAGRPEETPPMTDPDRIETWEEE